MERSEADYLIKAIRQLVDGDAPKSRLVLADRIDDVGAGEDSPIEMAQGVTAAALDLHGLADPEIVEALYRAFKHRILDDLRSDPIFVELLAARNEIEVVITPRREQIDGTTLRGRLARLIAQGWFSTARKTGSVRTQLTKIGKDPGSGGQLIGLLREFKADGFLVDDGGESFIVAPGIKVTESIIEAR